MITMRQIAMPCLLFAAIPGAISARAEALPAETARTLAEHGEILPLAEVLLRLRPAVNGDIIEVALDREGGRYLYKIKALDQNGQYREYRADARTGASVGEQ
jgi:uncharacterized membrane protein YkoI